MNTIAKLGVGPMSPEIVEAVFSYSEKTGKPLMLIASKNQIDWDGGYCGAWTTAEYAEFIGQMKNKYLSSKVYICRDHCGVGFKNDEIYDVYKTIDADLENGFNLIHIDFCHFKGSYEKILESSKKAIEYILKKNPKILLEIGTDENTGEFKEDLGRVEEQMKFFTELAPIKFFVTQTGSLVKETEQVGSFNKVYIEKIRKLADKYQINLKEHNCDYTTAADIAKRKGLIDAVNVAPQYGVIQTMLTLQKAYTYGIDAGDFLNDSYKNGKWEKWLYKNDSSNKQFCAIIAGHYVFANTPYQKLFEKISEKENFKQTIIDEMGKNFNMYLENL